MVKFLLLVDELRHRHAVHVDIYYSKTLDWVIKVWMKGCALDYPKSSHEFGDAVLVHEQDPDMESVFAKAHAALKQWLIDNMGDIK